MSIRRALNRVTCSDTYMMILPSQVEVDISMSK